MGRVAIDSNIILDFFLHREPFATQAEQIFEMIYNREIAAYTTANNLTDIYYFLNKGLGAAKAKEIIGQLLETFVIISVTAYDCLNALNFPTNDFEDALMTACAKKESIPYLITNDKNFLKTKSNFVNIISSQEFLSFF